MLLFKAFKAHTHTQIPWMILLGLISHVYKYTVHFLQFLVLVYFLFNIILLLMSLYEASLGRVRCLQIQILGCPYATGTLESGDYFHLWYSGLAVTCCFYHTLDNHQKHVGTSLFCIHLDLEFTFLPNYCNCFM